jgi:DNA modification methylase
VKNIGVSVVEPVEQFEPAYDRDGIKIYLGDCRKILKRLPEQSVNCCVTSPPYFGLRDYGCDEQIGLEETPEEFVAEMVAVFREVKRVLRDDGTLWLNLGDSYNAYNGGAGPSSSLSRGAQTNERPQLATGFGLKVKELKPKELIGIPWMVAFALRSDGWNIRQDIIWHKPNPMPESVTDRCTKSHEYIFLLTKSERYSFDNEAFQELATNRPPGNTKPTKGGRENLAGDDRHRTAANLHTIDARETRNKRSVWTVPVKPYKGAHFATFPADLIQPCVAAGCPEGGTVLDPFTGSGTTAEVARANGCKFIGCELNPDYLKLAKKRFKQRSLSFVK